MSGPRGRRPVSLSRRLAEAARTDAPRADAGMALGGVFEGLRGLADGLGKLAEAAQQAQHAPGGTRVEIGGQDGRMVFGYAVRTLDGAVQAFGHVPQPKQEGLRVPEARQPIVDVFEEADAILVVAEVPGLDPERLTLSVEDGALRIEGEGSVRYRHRVPLPGPVDAAAMTKACRNGILDVRLPRSGKGEVP
jgi:HSP20 family protein